MKTDNYLSLCLEQAAKSPLHYRHGCIVVRGGKVIGQGYNDHRAGYDGGSLKDGRIANGGFDGPAIADLKEKMKKQKDEPKPKQQQPQQQKSQTFVPFEGTGGGHGANTPLSMHSEMMAVLSALAASSTLSSTAMSSKKPCFKLPSGDKRKARLRRETLATYVNTICETAQRGGQPQGHNNNVQQQEQQGLDDEEDEDLEARCLKDKSLAFQTGRSGEKHHQKRQKNEKKKDGKKHQYEYQYDRHGQQQQQQRSLRQPSASKHREGRGIEDHDRTTKRRTITGQSSAPAPLQHDEHKKDYKRSGKMRPNPGSVLLLPKGHASSSSRSVAEREKNPRLNGADMYVARLGWCGEPAKKSARDDLATLASIEGVVANANEEESSPSSPPSPSSNSGCLHDELINREPSPVQARSSPRADSLDISTVRASRPCYRCITYIHSAGIKRIFWTNDAGEWEGGKVRDLVEALDSSMENVALKDGPGGGPTGNGVFVTKHEVLMLRRMMGRREGV